MSIRRPTCCRALQRQLPVAPDSVWLSDEHLFAAFQRFYAVSKTTRRYGSFVPGPLEARRRLGKRRITLLSESSPTYDSQSSMSWGLFGRADKTQWEWKPPTTRPKPQEKPIGVLPDWLLSWSNKHDVDVADEQNATDSVPLVDKCASVEDEAQYFQIHFAALSLQENISRWNTFSAQLQRDLTLGLVSEELIIRIRDMIWDMGGVFPEHESTLSYRLKLYKVLCEGLKTSKVFTTVDLEATTVESFVIQIASLPFSPSVQRLLQELLSSTSSTQLEQMESGLHFVIEKWTDSWLVNGAIDSHHFENPNGVSELDEALSSSSERIDELHGLVAALCNIRATAHFGKGPNLGSRILAVHAAVKFTGTAISSCQNMLDRTQSQMQIPMDAKSIRNLAEILANVPRNILLPILSTHAKLLAVKERRSHYVKTCYMSMIDQLPLVDTRLSLTIRRDLELGGLPAVEPEMAFFILSQSNSLGLVEEDALCKIIGYIEAGVSSPVKNQIACLIFFLHEQNHDTWNLIDILLSMLHKQGRYDELLLILNQLHDLEYKIPSVIFNNLVRILYTFNLQTACSVYQLSHDMLPEGDIMEAYRNSDFLYALIDDERFECRSIWEEVLRIPWYNPIPHGIRINLPKDSLSVKEHRFFEQMALKFAHAECRPPGLAFANINQILWHIRQRKCQPTANISKAMCHAVITRDIARGGPTTGWIGPSRLDYVLDLVTKLEGNEVAKEIAQLINIWRQYLTNQAEARRREAEGR